MRSKHAILVFFSLFLFLTTVSAGTITDDFQNDSPTEIISSIPQFIGDMLHFPDSADAGPVAIWLGGLAFTLIGFRLAIENFDNKVGRWIGAASITGTTNKDYWLIGAALSLMFIGGTNFLGWVGDLVTMLIAGALLFGIGIAIRVLWSGGSFAGGQALTVGHQARTGWLGQNVRAAADAAQSTWGGGGLIDGVYNDYKDIKICDNDGHLNPGASVGDNCWTGCGGNVINR